MPISEIIEMKKVGDANLSSLIEVIPFLFSLLLRED
jgi:hypothetical protein